MDQLPESLAGGSRLLLAYRIQLMNSTGRTAGPSSAVYAAGGAAPAGVAGFAGDPTSAGVELRWQKQDDDGAVELDRTLLDPTSRKAANRVGDSVDEGTRPLEIKMLAGVASAADPGGAVDRTVEVGHRYRYTAQRLVTTDFGGRTLELRSMPTEALTFAVRDIFPPVVPEGLVAVPGFAAERLVIDLSWEPVMDQNVKPKLAGYKVYRLDSAGGTWRLLGTATIAGYQDATVGAGQQYTYRVTAISKAGNESSPGGEAVETAPAARP